LHGMTLVSLTSSSKNNKHLGHQGEIFLLKEQFHENLMTKKRSG
jgi:hypothetical protein